MEHKHYFIKENKIVSWKEPFLHSSGKRVVYPFSQTFKKEEYELIDAFVNSILERDVDMVTVEEIKTLTHTTIYKK